MDIGYHLPGAVQQHLPGTLASDYIDGEYISDGNMRTNISNQDHEGSIQEYMKAKYDWDDHIMQKIDWNLIQEMLGKRPIHQSTNIIKFIYGWQHVGSQKLHFNRSSKDIKCVLCQEEEVQHHYILYGVKM